MSDEAHSIVNGQKADRHIHEPILASISPEAHKRHLARARKRAKEHHGLDDAAIKLLYGEEK